MGEEFRDTLGELRLRREVQTRIRTEVAGADIEAPLAIVPVGPFGTPDSWRFVVYDMEGHVQQVTFDGGSVQLLYDYTGAPLRVVTYAATYGDRTVELRDGRIVLDVRAPERTKGAVVSLRS